MVTDKTLRIKIEGDVSDFENAARTGIGRAREIELAVYRATALIETVSRLSKRFFGVELPESVRDGINTLQGFIATARTAQALASSLGVTSLAGIGSAIGGIALGATGIGIAAVGGYRTYTKLEERGQGGWGAALFATTTIGIAAGIWDWILDLFGGNDEKTG